MSDHKYWLISVPGDKNSNPGRESQRKSFDATKVITNRHNSPASQFQIPADLKVGTLDALMLLSDELDKYDKHADNVLKRIVRSFSNDVSEGDLNAASNLKVDAGSGDVDPAAYLQDFMWNESRFPCKGHLPELANAIHKEIVNSDEEVKESLQQFSQVRNAINANKRKSGGNLVVRDLNSLVNASHYVNHPSGELSEKIIPVFIVVPKMRITDFLEGVSGAVAFNRALKEEDGDLKDLQFEGYERCTQEVVPGSWKKISEDDSYVLGRVLHLDSPSLQTFKQKINDNKCTVREFKLDAAAYAEDKQQLEKLQEEEVEKRKHAKRILMTMFGEVFVCHCHLKAVRIFVESVLWYGLPVNFSSMVVKVSSRNEAGLQSELDVLWANAKGNGGKSEEDDERPYLKYDFDLGFLHEE